MHARDRRRRRLLFANNRAVAVAAPVGPTTYISDGFSGASATLAGRTPDTTGATTWSVHTGTVTTDGTQATCSTSNSRASIDAAHADGTVKATLPAIGVGDVGLLFRGVDGLNHWYIIWNAATGHWKLVKVIANASTVVDSSKTTPIPVAGDVLSVVLSGNTITAFLNATQITTTIDAQFATATRHGLASVTVSSGSVTWDAFQVTA